MSMIECFPSPVTKSDFRPPKSVKRTGARASVRIVIENMNSNLQSVSAQPAPVAELFR